ncbi:uncharacterized protein LOC134458343 [Engraulis encrasicolus]|uniref:uncharacterized protein LOC134458343 n=1 Tax=Engraulis encrasicolus TaxID=184585 RepID=UPI002FD51AE4
MPSCCVTGCTNRDTKKHRFYAIPRGNRPFQTYRRGLWLKAIKRTDWTEDIIRNARVCGDHFISGEMSLDHWNPDFVPSIFLKAEMKRYLPVRHEKVSERFVFASPGQPSAPATEDEQHKDITSGDEKDIRVIKMEYDHLPVSCTPLREEEDHHSQLEEPRQQLREENKRVKEGVGLTYSGVSFSNVKFSVAQLVFFTGVTSVVFDWLSSKLTGTTHFVSIFR